MKLSLVALLSLFALAGCTKDEPVVDVVAPGPLAAELPGEPADRALALFAVQGDSAVDVDIRDLQEKLKQLPKKHDYWVLLGEAWVKKARQSFDPGFYLHADGAAKVALAIEPDSRVARHLRGLVMLNNHDFASARDLALTLTRDQPADPMAWGVLSDALLELGDVDGASAAADQMMDKKPNLPSYARSSYLNWLRGNDKESLEAIRLAIDAGLNQKDREPSAWVLVEAATIFWHRGDVEGAIAGCDRALTSVPSYPPALALKARALLDLGRAAEARPLAERALDQSALVDTARLVADIATALKDDAAAAAVARAKQIGESSDHRGLALLLADRGEDLERALTLIDDDRKIRGGVYSDDVKAWVLFKLGRLPEARVLSDQALALKTPDRRLLEHAAAIRAAQKDPSSSQLAADAKRLR
jgi:tetratricopeptide (TPR) repeat protein